MADAADSRHVFQHLPQQIEQNGGVLNQIDAQLYVWRFHERPGELSATRAAPCVQIPFPIATRRFASIPVDWKRQKADPAVNSATADSYYRGAAVRTGTRSGLL